jgi:hypothetical protein
MKKGVRVAGPYNLCAQIMIFENIRFKNFTCHDEGMFPWLLRCIWFTSWPLCCIQLRRGTSMLALKCEKEFQKKQDTHTKKQGLNSVTTFIH